MTVSILLVEAGDGVDEVPVAGVSDFPIVFLPVFAGVAFSGGSAACVLAALVPAVTFTVITGLSGLAALVALFCFFDMDCPSFELRRRQRRHEGEPREAQQALRGSHSNAPFR